MSHLPRRDESVFATSIHRADLSFLAPDRERLVGDILELVQHGGMPDVPGRQTEPNLQRRPEEHWRRAFGCIGQVLDELGQHVQRRVGGSTTTTSWALVLDGPDSYLADRRMTHNHFGATYSTVLWLQLPHELTRPDAARPLGGTTFVDPLAFARRRYGHDTTWIARAAELELVVFPSYLDHYPEPVPPGPEFSRPRVVLSTDVTFS